METVKSSLFTLRKPEHLHVQSMDPNSNGLTFGSSKNVIDSLKIVILGPIRDLYYWWKSCLLKRKINMQLLPSIV